MVWSAPPSFKGNDRRVTKKGGETYRRWSEPPKFHGETKGWFPKGWFWRMFPRNENRNEGTFGCSPERRTGTRVHSDVPPERKPERGYIRQNHPFRKPPFYLLVKSGVGRRGHPGLFRFVPFSADLFRFALLAFRNTPICSHLFRWSGMHRDWPFLEIIAVKIRKPLNHVTVIAENY